MPSQILAAALDYAAKGLPVFPVNPRTKKPYVSKPKGGGKGGFHEATTDAKQIAAWWQQLPDAMIGIPMGARSKRWDFDVDSDPKKGIDGQKTLAELIAKNGPLPDTLTALTPRGTHRFFAWNGVVIRNSSGKIGPGIDVRGEGGYAIVPPSVRANGAMYRWHGTITEPVEAPQWLVDEAVRASKKTSASAAPASTKTQTRTRPRTQAGQAWALAALAQECDAVANTQAGERNDRLNRAAYNLGQIVAGGGLDEQEVRDCLFEAAEQCGLVADDGAQAARATIDSGLQAGLAQPRTRQTRQGPQPQPAPGPQPAPAQRPASAPPPPQGPQSPPPPPQPQPRALPVIRIAGGKLIRAVDEAEAALIAAGGRNIYQRGDLLVRPIKSQLRAANDRYTFLWQLFPLSKPFMLETFMRVACFEKMDLRAGGYVSKDCPDKLVETYLSRVGHWRLPVLLGIVNAPFLRPDGSLCEQPGYDPASELLFVTDGQTFPPIAPKPTLDDARTALKYLDDTLLEEFPFIEDIDRSVALSLLLTALDRRSMAAAPLHGFTSPVAGTGKSLLVDLASILASGDTAAVTSLGKSEEESEKRLGAALIAGDQIITLDNCDREVEGSFLCQALTQRRVKIRVLGFSRQIDTPTTSLFCATGNNLVIANDLVRRTLLCRLDAEMERPELRSFKRDVLEIAHSERCKLVTAALTVLRAWHEARTAIGIKPLGGYEDWSFRIRQPLIWLDRMDPCESDVSVRNNDPGRVLLIAVLEQWKRCLGVISKYSVQQIITRAIPDMDFFNALMPVAADKAGGLSNMRLGRWLSKNEGKIVGRLRLCKASTSAGYPPWQVVEK